VKKRLVSNQPFFFVKGKLDEIREKLEIVLHLAKSAAVYADA